MKKKINFLGIEMDVLDDEAIEEAEQEGNHHNYMVIRCVDSDPNAGSLALRTRRRRTPCEKCRAICWIDPKSYEPVARLQHTIICQVCMLAAIKEEKDG